MDVNSAIICAHCKKIPIDVVESLCCSELFCWECILECQQCPTCYELIDPSRSRANNALRRLLNTLSVPCKFLGCDKIMTMSEKRDHEFLCTYRPISCPNNSACEMIRELDLPTHIKDQCPFRIVQCPQNCGSKIQFNQIEEHLKDQCIAVEITCKHCSSRLSRVLMDSHLKHQCEFFPLECEFAAFGCTENPIRSLMDHHMEEASHDHLKMMSKILKNQTSEIEILKKIVQEQEEKIESQLIFRKECFQMTRQYVDTGVNCATEMAYQAKEKLKEIKNKYGLTPILIRIFFFIFLMHIIPCFLKIAFVAGIIAFLINKSMKSTHRCFSLRNMFFPIMGAIWFLYMFKIFRFMWIFC